MAEANPDTGTITDEAAMDLMFEEHGANLEDPDHAAPDAEEVTLTPEGDEFAQDEPETAEVEQPAEAPTFTVKIDGKDVQVTQDELLSGYQRQADYTRKTQEVAQARQHIEAGTTELKAALQFWATPQQQEPNWVELAHTMEPRDFQTAQAQWAQQRQRQVKASQLYQRISHQEHSTMLQREQAALLERIPEWSNRDTARADMAAITSAGAEFGFSEQEIGSITDHRVILMARELSRLKGASAALQTQKQATPQARAAIQGRAAVNDTAARQKTLLDKARKSGSDDDFAAFLMG